LKGKGVEKREGGDLGESGEGVADLEEPVLAEHGPQLPLRIAHLLLFPPSSSN